MDPGLTNLPQRIAHRAGSTLRASWAGAASGLVGGLVLEALLPMRHAWLPAAVAVGCATIFVICMLIGDMSVRRSGGRPLEVRGLARVAVLERSSTVEQYGHAFGSAALLLFAISVGAWMAGAFGL